MLCEKCKKNDATYYYHENINGSERTFRLCGDCAKKMEETDELPKLSADRYFEDLDAFFEAPFQSMNSLFSGFFGGDRALGSGTKSEGGTEKKCEACGTTLREFVNRGAGCPKCFETFADEVKPAITGGRNRTDYAGHAPSKFRGRIENKRRIEALVAEQREAVKNEDFERAAEIRDELRRLRGETESAPTENGQQDA